MGLYVEESIPVTTILKNIQNSELKNLLLHSMYNLIEIFTQMLSNTQEHSRTFLKQCRKGRCIYSNLLKPHQTI